MNLQQRLDRISQGFKKQAPSEAVALMCQIRDDLRNSGIARRALGEGGVAPSFALDDSQGNPVKLDSLLARGPLVMTFFRGHW